MAKNFIQDGRLLTVTAPAAVSSGDMVKVGSVFGVAQNDAANGVDVGEHCLLALRLVQIHQLHQIPLRNLQTSQTDAKHDT